MTHGAGIGLTQLRLHGLPYYHSIISSKFSFIYFSFNIPPSYTEYFLRYNLFTVTVLYSDMGSNSNLKNNQNFYLPFPCLKSNYTACPIAPRRESHRYSTFMFATLKPDESLCFNLFDTGSRYVAKFRVVESSEFYVVIECFLYHNYHSFNKSPLMPDLLTHSSEAVIAIYIDDKVEHHVC